MRPLDSNLPVIFLWVMLNIETAQLELLSWVQTKGKNNTPRASGRNLTEPLSQQQWRSQRGWNINLITMLQLGVCLHLLRVSQRLSLDMPVPGGHRKRKHSPVACHSFLMLPVFGAHTFLVNVSQACRHSAARGDSPAVQNWRQNPQPPPLHFIHFFFFLNNDLTCWIRRFALANARICWPRLETKLESLLTGWRGRLSFCFFQLGVEEFQPACEAGFNKVELFHHSKIQYLGNLQIFGFLRMP